MEMMPYQPTREDGARPEPGLTPPSIFGPRATSLVVSRAWQAGLPVLEGRQLALRELHPDDAPSLCALLTTEEVARFISPPPTTVEGFVRFIAWAQRERAQGRYACFAVVPLGGTTAVGLFQIRLLDTIAHTAEWGFALGQPYWGTGLFLDGARLVVRFAFETLGLCRLEARACLANGRGTGALRKIGAVRELILRNSFERAGQFLDQGLWTILREDWQRITGFPSRTIH